MSKTAKLNNEEKLVNLALWIHAALPDNDPLK